MIDGDATSLDDSWFEETDRVSVFSTKTPTEADPEEIYPINRPTILASIARDIPTRTKPRKSRSVERSDRDLVSTLDRQSIRVEGPSNRD
jgi:hypothetical protein